MFAILFDRVIMSTETNESAQALGTRVADARKRKNLTLSQLADLAGVSKAYLYQLEKGACPRPSAHVLFNIASQVGTSIAHLLGKAPGPWDIQEVEIPNSLQEFARKEGLSTEEMKELAAIRRRGKAPESADDWRFIYEAIKRTIRDNDTG